MRLGQRPLVLTKIDSCRRRLRLFILESFDDSALDIDTVKVGSCLLQSHIPGLGEEEIDSKQFDKDPHIVHDVVCKSPSVLVSLRWFSALGKLTFPSDAVQRNRIGVLVEDQRGGDEEIVEDQALDAVGRQ